MAKTPSVEGRANGAACSVERFAGSMISSMLPGTRTFSVGYTYVPICTRRTAPGIAYMIQSHVQTAYPRQSVYLLRTYRLVVNHLCAVRLPISGF